MATDTEETSAAPASRPWGVRLTEEGQPPSFFRLGEQECPLLKKGQMVTLLHTVRLSPGAMPVAWAYVVGAVHVLAPRPTAESEPEPSLVCTATGLYEGESGACAVAFEISSCGDTFFRKELPEKQDEKWWQRVTPLVSIAVPGWTEAHPTAWMVSGSLHGKEREWFYHFPPSPDAGEIHVPLYRSYAPLPPPPRPYQAVVTLCSGRTVVVAEAETALETNEKWLRLVEEWEKEKVFRSATPDGPLWVAWSAVETISIVLAEEPS